MSDRVYSSNKRKRLHGCDFREPGEEKRCYLDEIAVQSAVVVQRNACLAGRFGRRRPIVHDAIDRDASRPLVLVAAAGATPPASHMLRRYGPRTAVRELLGRERQAATGPAESTQWTDANDQRTRATLAEG